MWVSFMEINYTYISSLGQCRLPNAVSRMVVSVHRDQVSTIHSVGGFSQLFINKLNNDSPNTIYINEMIKKRLTKLSRITANECDP